MKKHNPLGKGFFWIGFALFILGLAFNESIGLIPENPETLSSFSVPSIIFGIVMIVVSNFFGRKD